MIGEVRFSGGSVTVAFRDCVYVRIGDPQLVAKAKREFATVDLSRLWVRLAFRPCSCLALSIHKRRADRKGGRHRAHRHAKANRALQEHGVEKAAGKGGVGIWMSFLA